MKNIQPILWLCWASFTVCPLASGQAFNSGSNGSYGPLNITSDTTLNLPSNGVFNCTSITIASGTTLTFNRNSLNTPVYLLATTNVVINGTIDVSAGIATGRTGGKGGPGGFDGGDGGVGGGNFGGTGLGADGQGPGGGHSTAWPDGSFGSPAYGTTNAYGNSLLVPLIGGSGGSGYNGNPGTAGGGGGGAVLIASNTRIDLAGNIFARGGTRSGCCGAGGGSGGAIRLIAPVVTGTGYLDAGPGGGGFAPGLGRVRVDCSDGYAARSLHPQNAVSSRGSQMYVFPPIQSRLDIIEAAGQSISAPASSAVTVVLPLGSPTNHTVKVQARDFTNNVPITLAVIPNDRPGSNYLTTITITNNPSAISVPVTLAVDSTNRIFVWTR